MKTYRNGEKVNYGLYLAPKALDFRFVGADDETLEGKDNVGYIRLPIALMILASPLIGGAFVMFFPILVVLIGMYAVVQFAVSKLSATLGKNAHLAVMRWEPTAAYLNKTERDKKKDKKEGTEKKQ